MKRKLILKLIESNDKPQIGDIVRTPEYNLGTIIELHTNTVVTTLFSNSQQLITDRFTVIKPITISDEKIGVGDKFIDLEENEIYTNKANISVTEDFPTWKKIELLPEHFSPTIKQFIVDELLKDGDAIEVECCDECDGTGVFIDKTCMACSHTSHKLKLDTEGYAHISIPSKESKVMYSEDEVRNLVIEAIQSFNDDVDEEVIISWFNQNKKK